MVEKPRKKIARRKIELVVVGMQYRVTMETRKLFSARLPMRARVEREPDNNNDPNAIKVVLNVEPYTGFHIGYLRRQIASDLAPLLDSGIIKAKKAVLTEIDRSAGEGTVVVTIEGRAKALHKRKSGGLEEKS
jgi:hypothetical protein